MPFRIAIPTKCNLPNLGIGVCTTYPKSLRDHSHCSGCWGDTLAGDFLLCRPAIFGQPIHRQSDY